ncbi:hypothetical protein [Methylobacterium sp. A54F]
MVSRSSIHRRLPWSRALADMRADRMVRPQIREELLRMRTPAAIDMSAWRGKSGRRYVVVVHPIAAAAALEAPGAVILGVRRGADQLAQIVGLGHAGTVQEAAELAAADGATELHLYRLADTDAERDAVVEDLLEDDDAT